MTKINQRTNRQTNQPTQINQPKSTNQNQPKPTTSSFSNPATWKLGVIFQADAATALADAQRLCRVFFFNGVALQRELGAATCDDVGWKYHTTLENWRNVTWKKGNHFRRIGIFIYPTRIFQGDVRGVFGGVTWKADKEQPFEKGKIIWTKPPLVGFRKEYYNIIFQHGV